MGMVDFFQCGNGRFCASLYFKKYFGCVNQPRANGFIYLKSFCLIRMNQRGILDAQRILASQFLGPLLPKHTQTELNLSFSPTVSIVAAHCSALTQTVV